MTQRPTSGTADQIVSAIVKRLISQFPEFNEATCFVSDSPEPIQVPRGSVFCTVSPGEGTFPEEFQSGGGVETLTEHFGVTITPYVLTRAGVMDETRDALLHPERGVLTRYKLRILRAMLYEWTPQQGDSIFFLRNSTLVAVSSSRGRYWGGESELYATLSLEFRADFDWELIEQLP
jgi:hypothetical protein